MSTQLRKMIRRFNLGTLKKTKAKRSSVKDERYHRLSSAFECNFLSMAKTNDADFVWESLSSLTIQAENERCSQSDLMTSDTEEDTSSSLMSYIPPETLLNDTIAKGASDATLLRIANCFPGLLGHRGDDGRYPVHAACTYAASSDLVYKCVSMYPHTAAAQDNDGRTPFHLLCKDYAKQCEVSTSLDKNAIERRMTYVLWILYRSAPQAIIIEDNEGVDAVEYALEADLSLPFIGILQHMVSKVHKQNAKVKAHRKLLQSRSVQNGDHCVSMSSLEVDTQVMGVEQY